MLGVHKAGFRREGHILVYHIGITVIVITMLYMICHCSISILQFCFYYWVTAVTSNRGERHQTVVSNKCDKVNRIYYMMYKVGL